MPAAGSNALAFQFVEQLAKEVSGGRVELPSFPDVAVRVRKVLADENARSRFRRGSGGACACAGEFRRIESRRQNHCRYENGDQSHRA
jgi:hypothetical protein